jgi:hypothetical protein
MSNEIKKVTFTVNAGKYAGNEIVEYTAASEADLKLRAMALNWTLAKVEE